MLLQVCLQPYCIFRRYSRRLTNKCPFWNYFSKINVTYDWGEDDESAAVDGDEEYLTGIHVHKVDLQGVRVEEYEEEPDTSTARVLHVDKLVSDRVDDVVETEAMVISEYKRWRDACNRVGGVEDEWSTSRNFHRRGYGTNQSERTVTARSHLLNVRY